MPDDDRGEQRATHEHEQHVTRLTGAVLQGSARAVAFEAPDADELAAIAQKVRGGRRREQHLDAEAAAQVRGQQAPSHSQKPIKREQAPTAPAQYFPCLALPEQRSGPQSA